MELRTYCRNRTVSFITIITSIILSTLVTSCHKNKDQKQTIQVSSDPVITNLYLKKFDSKVTDCYNLDLQNFAFIVGSVNNNGAVLGNISSTENKCRLDSEYIWNNNNLTTTTFPASQIPYSTELKYMISSNLTANNTHIEQVLVNLISNPSAEFSQAYLVSDHLQHIDDTTQITALSDNGKYFSAKPISTIDPFSWVYIDSKIIPLHYDNVEANNIIYTDILSILNNGMAGGTLLYKDENGEIVQKLMVCDFSNNICKALPSFWSNETHITQALITGNNHIYGTIVDENDEPQIFDYDIDKLSNKVILQGYSINQHNITHNGLIVVADSDNNSYIYNTANNKLYGAQQIAKIAHLLNINEQLLTGSNIFLSPNEQYVVIDTNINNENLLAIKIFFPKGLRLMLI